MQGIKNMSVIEVKQLTKVFKIPKKEPGLGGAVKGLFRPQFENKTAVNEINFKLEQARSSAISRERRGQIHHDQNADGRPDADQRKYQGVGA
jgi:hypothetical protein